MPIYLWYSCGTRPCDTIAVQGPAIKLPNIVALQTCNMQFCSVMQSLMRYMQEKFNSIVFKVRSFVSLCWYQNNESRSQVDGSHDSGAKTLPQECICDDKHARKEIKETIEVNKEITRRSHLSSIY